MKLFLDANVMFSAAYTVRGRSSLLFALALDSGVGLQSSAYAIEEARRNLQTRFADRLHDFLPLLPLVQVVPEPVGAVLNRVLDLGIVPKDAPVLAAALQAKSDVFVTGDRRHFAALFGQRVEGVLVLCTSQALDALASPTSEPSKGRNRR